MHGRSLLFPIVAALAIAACATIPPAPGQWHSALCTPIGDDGEFCPLGETPFEVRLLSRPLLRVRSIGSGVTEFEVDLGGVIGPSGQIAPCASHAQSLPPGEWQHLEAWTIGDLRYEEFIRHDSTTLAEGYVVQLHAGPWCATAFSGGARIDRYFIEHISRTF